MKSKRNIRRRIRWDRVALLLLTVYLVIGITWAAIDSHRRPDHHTTCIRDGICSVND